MTTPSLPVGALHEPARYTAPEAPITSATLPPHPVWSIWQRVGFRLVFSYFARYLRVELDLTGIAGADMLHIALRRIGMQGFLLVDRDFQWINEVPFNS